MVATRRAAPGRQCPADTLTPVGSDRFRKKQRRSTEIVKALEEAGVTFSSFVCERLDHNQICPGCGAELVFLGSSENCGYHWWWCRACDEQWFEGGDSKLVPAAKSPIAGSGSDEV